MKTGHIPALDGLRGIAVLTVMLLHFNMLHSSSGLDSYVNMALETGWVGVDLFFVLSGFLITGILYDSKQSASYFRTFYARRALRIFPLYYAFVALIFLVLPRLLPDSVSRLDTAPWFLTYTGNFLFADVGWEGMPEHTVHLWSLAVEEQFYLLWPLAVFLLARVQLIRFALFVILAATVFRAVTHVVAPGGIAGYALLPARMDALAVGALIALVLRGQEGESAVVKFVKPAAVAGLAMLAMAVGWSVAFGDGPGLLPALARHTQLLGYPATELISAALVIVAITANAGSAADSLLNWKPLISFGKYSYGLYLIHVPVRDVLRSILHDGTRLPSVFGSQLISQAGVFVIGIGASYLLAFLSWHCFEKHFLRLKVRFPYGETPTPATATRKPLSRLEISPAQMHSIVGVSPAQRSRSPSDSASDRE